MYIYIFCILSLFFSICIYICLLFIFYFFLVSPFWVRQQYEMASPLVAKATMSVAHPLSAKPPSSFCWGQRPLCFSFTSLPIYLYTLFPSTYTNAPTQPYRTYIHQSQTNSQHTHCCTLDTAMLNSIPRHCSHSIDHFFFFFFSTVASMEPC